MNREIITIENGIVSVPVSNEIWMTQYQLADLFQCFISKINANIRAILKTGVFDESKVCRTYHYKNGNSVEQYNLEMIIALSFRIQSRNAEVFRQFLTRRLSKPEIPEILIRHIQNTILNWMGFPIQMTAGHLYLKPAVFHCPFSSEHKEKRRK